MLDQLFDLPASRRFILYVVILVAIAGLYYYLIHRHGAVQIAEKEAQLQSLEAERNQLQAKLKRKDKLMAEITEVEAHLKQVTTQLPEQKEIPELLRQVSNLGRDSGLDITLFRQRGENLHDLYAEVPVEMTVRGGYHQIALFFEKVRHLNRIVNIGNISIRDPQMIDGRLQVEGAFSATTYRFLTEEEQARIAKQKEEEEQKKKRR